MKTFVISLQHRLDRRDKTVDGMKSNHFVFEFQNATDISKYNSMFSTSFSTSKHAIWHSHILIYEKLLLSKENWILVLEDDIDFDSSNLVPIDGAHNLFNTLERISDRLCMVQFGFNFEPGIGFRQIISDAFYSVFRFRRYDFYELNQLRRELDFLGLIQVSRAISNGSRFSFAVKGHQRGTHYYAINRKLAIFAIDHFYKNSTNSEILPIDMFFSQLSQKADDYLIVRPSLPFAHQSESYSDNRY